MFPPPKISGTVTIRFFHLKLLFFELPLEYKAVYTYTSESEGDLSFQEGSTILVYWANPNGWWFGSVDGKQGYFPGSYVEVRMIVPCMEHPLRDDKNAIFCLQCMIQ